MTWQHAVVRTALWSLSATALPFLTSSRYSGIGGILAFHRIYEPKPYEFGSQATSVTPKHFRYLIQTLIRHGYSFLSMSALIDRLVARDRLQEKVVCLTFDDGFVDNFTAAYPICREYAVPMTIYLVSGIIRREFPMWSFALETAVANNETLELTCHGQALRLNCRTRSEKRSAYFALSSRLAVALPNEIRQVCGELTCRYGIDVVSPSDRNALTASMIAEMQDSGLVEFGAHSVHHAYLGALKDAEAYWEIEQSKRDCEALVGAKVCHFAYPYGDAKAAGVRESVFCQQLGFRSAVTTESNTIFSSDSARLLRLPRLVYNGYFQDAPQLELLLSGVLPKLKRRRDSWRLTGTVQRDLKIS
jgi:peptidoglycan/xylan/chitin deacetylase (PgdA/CDA1 family)